MFPIGNARYELKLSVTFFPILSSRSGGGRMREHLLLLQGMLSEPAKAGVLGSQPDHSLFSRAQTQFRKHTAAPQDLGRSDS